MNWDTTCQNASVVEAFNDYRDLVSSIATLYAGSRLVESVDLSVLGSTSRLAISNDFPDCLTTIRTIGQLQDSIRSGGHGQLAIGLATVQLCTAFEILFDRIANEYSICVTPADSFFATHWVAPGGSMTLGNRTLRQIRKIHSVYGLNSRLNSDEALIKISAIIEVRNCIVHSGGMVREQKVADRLWAYKIPSTIGHRLVLKDNHLDDFLHYMAIHVLSFVNHAP